MKWAFSVIETRLAYAGLLCEGMNCSVGEGLNCSVGASAKVGEATCALEKGLRDGD